MDQYPFSYTSSKKLKSSARTLQQKSACQAANPNIVDPKDYNHILQGEKVFIELYYQGRVIDTAYNQWVSVMGGILYKRLHSKVTIFLTNADQNQFGAIRERTRRCCPNCKIVSILWFEECFKHKEKVPFEDFEVEKELNYKIEERQKVEDERPKYDEEEVAQLLRNICEDTSVTFRQYFKQNKGKFCSYVPKNKQIPQENLLKARQFDLGPRIKKKHNRSTHDELRGNSRLSLNKKDQANVKKYDKKKKKPSLKKDQIKQVENKIETKQEVIETVVENLQQKYEKTQHVSINQLMEKYLSKKQLQSSQQSKAKILQNDPPFLNRKEYASPKKQQKVIDLCDDNSSQTAEMPRPKPSRLSHSNDHKIKQVPQFPSKYKSAREKSKKEYQNQQVQLLKQYIKNQPKTSIILISDSTTVATSIDRINSKKKLPKELTIKLVHFSLYWDFINSQGKVPHLAYFVFNPSRISDRPLFFALKTIYPSAIMISVGILEQIAEYNTKIRNNYQYSTEENPSIRLRKLKELSLNVDEYAIKGKKILFMNCNIPLDVIKVILDKLQGIYMSESAYMKGEDPNIMVTSRFGINDKRIRYMNQQSFWKMVFPNAEQRAH